MSWKQTDVRPSPCSPFADTLARPSLLSRHLALASQTNSLTSFLALANPNAYNAQISHFNESITTEAQHHNIFSGADGGTAAASQSNTNDALFSNSRGTDEVKAAPSSHLVQVQYTDEQNPLRRLAPHPFFPLDSEKGQIVLPPLLLPKPDENVLADQEKRWKAWASRNGVPLDGAQGANVAGNDAHWIELVRDQIKEHDGFAGQAIRSFVHAREATDDLGQRYDWQMRLNPEEASDDEDEDLDEAGEAGEGDAEQGRKRKRNEQGSDETPLSLRQIASFLNTGEL